MSAPPTVLLIAAADDIHALAVQRRLAQISDHPTFGRIVDTRTFPYPSSVEWGALSGGGGFSAELHLAAPLMAGVGRQAAIGSPLEVSVELDQIVSVWMRRPGDVGIDKRIETEEFRDYAALAARAALGPVFASRPTFNQPAVEHRLRWKPLQLLRAERCGIPIPRSLVTSSVPRALAFVEALKREGKAVIYKQVASTADGPPTRAFADADWARIDDVALCPTLFQERIVGGVDLRIAVVGDQVFAAEWRRERAPSHEVDVRLDREAGLWPVTLPPEFRAQLAKLQGSLELDIGVYDFKCDALGVPHFLEVNPSGQWLGLEVDAHWPVSWHVAQLLSRSKEVGSAPDPFNQADLSVLMDELESTFAVRAGPT